MGRLKSGKLIRDLFFQAKNGLIPSGNEDALSILFVNLVSDDILQMALGLELLKKFGGSFILHNIDQRHLLHIQTTSSRAIIHKEDLGAMFERYNLYQGIRALQPSS